MNNTLLSVAVPVVGFAAFSGTGKTSLLKKLIALLHSKQIRVGIIKQSHHDFEVDIPGKDSYELRKAGASQTMITSPYRKVFIEEYHQPAEADLSASIHSLNTSSLDIIFVEGFKHAPFPKIELQRSEFSKPLLYPDDANIIAIATDSNDTHHTIPVLDLNDTDEIYQFIHANFLTSKRK